MTESRKNSRPRKLKAPEVQELLATVENQRDLELSRVGAGEARLLSDGRLLLKFEDGKGILYQSRGDVTEVLRRAEERVAAEPPRHPARELLPQGKSFPAHVATLVESLPRILETPPGSLDMTEESLDVVERAIHRLRARRLMNTENFPPLVAYVGEVIRKATHGEWKMHHDPGDDSWEPLIVDANGGVYQPFALVHGELLLGTQGSIRGAVNGALRADSLSTDHSRR